MMFVLDRTYNIFLMKAINTNFPMTARDNSANSLSLNDFTLNLFTMLLRMVEIDVTFIATHFFTDIRPTTTPSSNTKLSKVGVNAFESVNFKSRVNEIRFLDSDHFLILLIY